MEDRVADILAERAAVESGAALALVTSVIAHAGLTALAMWAAWHHTTTQAPSVMTIRFAQTKPRAAAPSVVAAAPAPAPAAPRPRVVAPPVQPVAKPVEASPFGRSTKKATPPAPVPAAPVAAVQTAPAAPPAQPDVTFEGGDFPYTVYIDRMKALIGSRWFRPQVSAGINAIVAFTINRDGMITDARVEKSSGSVSFDNAGLRAVRESSPLPPLPFGYSGTYLGVHLTFR